MLAAMQAEGQIAAAVQDKAGAGVSKIWAIAGRRQISIYKATAILLVWAGSWFIAMFVEPNYDEFSIAELTYYSIYNVAVGAFIGFYLFDPLARDRLPGFVLRASVVIVVGTLLNETLVEPLAFGAGPINGDGLYYGLLDALVMVFLFTVIRLVGQVTALQRHAAAALKFMTSNSVTPEPACFFVRVAGETRRIYAQDVLFFEAEKDFTRIICANSEHFASESLKSLIAKAEPFGIARVHKSFAVNLKRVERITRADAHIGDRSVPIGRRYLQAFVERWADRPGRHPGIETGEQ